MYLNRGEAPIEIIEIQLKCLLHLSQISRSSWQMRYCESVVTRRFLTGRRWFVRIIALFLYGYTYYSALRCAIFTGSIY